MISIIIPLYNKEKTITKTIESILVQRYNNYEIVIVDDGSIDSSISQVESFNDKRIRLFKKGNGGPSSARNYGVTKAIGDWILFLDADDTLVPDALTIIAKDIFNIYDIDVFTYNLFVETNGNKSIRNKKHAQGVLCIPFINYFLDEIYPRTGNMVCRRQVLLKEPFDETIRRHEDTQNTFRLMRKYRFYASEKPIFSYNQDTLEACFRRDNYNEDFSCIMNPKGKSIFEQICMYKIYMKDVKVTYPDLYLKIYGTTFEKKYYKYLTYLLFKTKAFKAKLLKKLSKLGFGMKNYI